MAQMATIPKWLPQQKTPFKMKMAAVFGQQSKSLKKM